MARGSGNRPDEFALIERYFRPLAATPGALGLIDDAATFLPEPNQQLVLTIDTIAEGIHFLAEDAPASVARKALRVNLSDLAAKGAKPEGYLLSLALPGDWTEEWVRDFAAALADDQKSFGISLLGGDTTHASGGCTISITAFGSLPKGEMVLRSGARPGDLIFVSGTIGDAALGLAARLGKVSATKKATAYLGERYLHPRPRLALAPVLRRFASSAMDISDGLMGDLGHICRASGVGGIVEAASVPLSDEARVVVARNEGGLALVLTGGDDYEILTTVGEATAETFREAAAEAGVPMTRIGRVTEPAGPPVVIDSEGKPLSLLEAGYLHF